MHNIGPDILGAYDAVPPPGARSRGDDDVLGIKFRPKKLLKKAGRGLKKAGKVAVKVHVKAIKTVAKAGKFAARKLATVAAIPIRRQFKTLGMRRARLLSWQRRKSMTPNVAEKREASSWSLAKMRSKGPIGKFGVKVLQFTRGATLGDLHAAAGAALQDTGEVVGMTGAEIAAAAAAVVAAISGIMKSLNKPGEAPADPRQGEPEASPDATEEAPSDDESASGWAGTGPAMALLGSLLGSLITSTGGPKKARKYPPPPPPNAADITREAAARDGYRPLKKAYRNRPAYQP